MNRMSQTFMLFAVMSGLISLTACVGGGGDGGGATPLAPRPTISAAEITGGMPQQGYLAEYYANLPGNDNLEDALKNYNLNGENLTIKYNDSTGNIEIYGNQNLLNKYHPAALPVYKEVIDTDIMTEATTSFLGEDPRGKTFENENWGPLHGTSGQPDVYFTGTALGGEEFVKLSIPKKGDLVLDYASFGMWGIKAGYVGTFVWNGQSTTFTEKNPFQYTDFYPVSGGDPAHAAIPDKDTRFTGKAMAMAAQYSGTSIENPIEILDLRGDATLTINSMGTGGNLALNFPNFYNIGFTFDITGNTFNNVGTPSITNNGNTTEINFPDPMSGPMFNEDETYLKGDFYGNGSASEASGRFNIDASNPSTNDQFIFGGSFGVKK
ncbi:MAG TPA: hypothetical protein H9768_09375 [Candidatus Mailhella merdavium]|nr:hypothetical protein [Candidatus Mailhella merdavium]